MAEQDDDPPARAAYVPDGTRLPDHLAMAQMAVTQTRSMVAQGRLAAHVAADGLEAFAARMAAEGAGQAALAILQQAADQLRG